jgi:hypothetical protein
VQRGFKAWAEREACEQRRRLGLRPEAPLPAATLAARLGVRIVRPEDIPGMSPALLRQLLEVDPGSWSAATVSCLERVLLITNTAHGPHRHESDVMHELAHLLCAHPPERMLYLDGGSIATRQYNDDHEEEAAWLGGCLQLTRDGLLWALGQGMEDAALVERYGASIEMVRYRRHVTGVELQLARSRRRL